MTGKQPKREPRDGFDNYGRTPLHFAAGDSLPDEVAKFIAAGVVVNVQDDNGWSALHFAAQAESLECAAELLRAEADHSLQDSFGNTALFRAVFSSRGEGSVIRLLRQAGADPFVKNKHGVSPVSLARTIANYNVAQFFSDIGKLQ
ncbi:ankyrin repeat domain-containing protein [Methylicorpusculum sp.]|uniref:ankyrin repeat domain-containing protein n=1 Tax=Methylicorpusculum sp. TaxID=2713644 RepID=UPI00273228F8|nr:ankyrin repeat domain-containing protein [Methylicorpusculum sp.]MDP2178493.1 ankyrin repeat domain-containing protein [Methylicorpusculum sp.]MDP3530322.1 ankyrin repeat domain-containing protein [Methylicorpusculum sp.]MDZ4152138.1 ankyrin repeat domain-containing protein [Methylicorpusculum sp.]